MSYVFGGFRWQRAGLQLELKTISHDHIGACTARSSAWQFLGHDCV
jgi:hypothetical protein